MTLNPFRWRREREDSSASNAARLLRAKGIEKQRARQAETTARLEAEVARMREARG